MKRKIWIGLLCVLLMILCYSIALANPYAHTYTDNNGVYHPGNCTWQTWEEVKNRLGIELPDWGNGGTWHTSAAAAGYQVVQWYNGYVPPNDCIIEWSGHVAYLISADSVGVNLVDGNILWGGQYIERKEQWWSWDQLQSYRGNPTYVTIIKPVNQLPIGNVDECKSNGNGTIHLIGWAFDPDTWSKDTRLELDIYIGADGYHGGQRYVTYTNGKERQDVHNVHGVGNYHGFEMDIAVNERGNQPIYIYAIDSSDLSKNTLIYSGTLNIKLATPTAISVTSSLNIQAGTGSVLSVSYTPSDTNTDYKGVTWSSSNENIATVNSSGRVTGVAEGNAVITATSKYNPSLKATCQVTVTRAIPVPTITSVEVNDYDVHIAWNASELINESDVRSYTVRLYSSYHIINSKTGITNTFCDLKVPGAGNNYRVTVTAVNTSNNTYSSESSQSFTVDTVLTPEWQEADSLPSNVTAENCEIEYKHTYRKTAQSSPGSGWTQVSGSGVTTYEAGDIFESQTELTVSETVRYVGGYYYHWCRSDGKNEAESFQTGAFDTYHNAGSIDGNFVILSSVQDGNVIAYRLQHGPDSPWPNQYAWCNDGHTYVWYRMYKYQNYTAKTTYTWTKTNDWSAEKDSSAYSVRYRFRLKDTAAPVVESLNVTAITPRDYTISCKVKDDVGIKKLVFANWTENETESIAKLQEKAVENSAKEAEVSATISISDHGNLRDDFYFTKVFVYDVRGNVTEYTGEEGKVYMPTMMHSASRKLILPASLTQIEEEAFADSVGFAEVILPDGVRTIGAKAFAECSRLTLIYMPDSLEQIAVNAFANSSNVVFLCESNNSAAAFARQQNIPYFTGE